MRDSKRLRVCIETVSVCAGKTPTCSTHVGVLPAHTETFEYTHGGVLNLHTGVFFSVTHTPPSTSPTHTTHINLMLAKTVKLFVVVVAWRVCLCSKVSASVFKVVLTDVC